MSDTSNTDTVAQDIDAETGDTVDEPDGDSGPAIAIYAQWAVFAILTLVALIATLQFYFSASSAIDTFVTDRYRPLFNAAFNLAVVLACGLGLSVLVRRLA
ncbi:hypothetical protein JZX76_12460 [Haloarcula hispanica]|uniref:DUF8060 domain-containing protein n=1 Tax=Haloarcula hispanica TaxID=51589 RepID=A0A482TCM8_HALHI|nr:MULTISPECIES: hypothetical protein [Haloarcula]AJF27027.1 hypothetical protein SG26_15440 [Haloarcula sp. CBA1115]KAA9407173.1 hypothetical protein Har1131_10310 [Haloarcula sp. CBA1131]KZX48572.1 hypothetical protein AV929_06305 [Haloarcula sp. K1]MCJ0620285.1 hypothetical protein [Haloarcula hispanica]RYJ10697.1 hypothetical protein ELS20_12360 [Haloarcula hispanica]